MVVETLWNMPMVSMYLWSQVLWLIVGAIGAMVGYSVSRSPGGVALGVLSFQFVFAFTICFWIYPSLFGLMG